MFPDNRPEPAPDQMLTLLRHALDRSDAQFRHNNDILARRGEDIRYQPGYVDVHIDTTNGTHTGRVFYIDVRHGILDLHPTDVTDSDLSLPTDVTYLRADTIEAAQVTFTFEGTFEVAITRDDLNAILDRLHDTATARNGSPQDNMSATISEAITVLRERGADPLRDTLDMAERDWRKFMTRTLSNANVGSGVVPSGWYLTAETDKADSPHYGEIAFQHMFGQMPTDYLYTDTRDDVCDALIEHVSVI